MQLAPPQPVEEQKRQWAHLSRAAEVGRLCDTVRLGPISTELRAEERAPTNCDDTPPYRWDSLGPTGQRWSRSDADGRVCVHWVDGWGAPNQGTYANRICQPATVGQWG
jgi:hypothetical protein